MPVTPDELIRLLAMLAEEEKLKVTVKETLKGSAMAGTGAVIGGLLGGPLGIAVGGSIGAVAGSYATWGKFKSVPEVLAGLDSDKQQILYNQGIEILKELPYTTFVSLVALVMGDASLKMLLLNMLKNFILYQLGMKVYK